MASSNIKLFDENKGNMLSDSEFSLSNQRMNGLQTGVASSQLQNKAMYQASLVAYAIAQVMMQNGLNANDTDAVSAFVANLSSTMLQKVYDIATIEEAKVGTATGKWMSPALVKAAIDTLAAKAQNILSDETKSLYKLEATATPDDVFAKLSMPNGYYGFDVTVRFSDGLPAANVLLNGLTDIYGNVVETDENGRCSRAMCSSKTATVAISNYIGVVDKSVEITAQDRIVFTPVTITLERDTAMKLIQTSQELRVLTGVPVDMCIVGGGAGGTPIPRPPVGANGLRAATGGGGGYAKNIMGKILKDPVVNLIVGAGGGEAGGETSVTYDNTKEAIQGGTQTEGNGIHSGDGTVHVFNDEALPLPGGGGGDGSFSSSQINNGGKDFGGRGGCCDQNTVYAAVTDATGPGGGGGGGVIYWIAEGNGHYAGNGTYNKGAGAAGGLYIRVNAPR